MTAPATLELRAEEAATASAVDRFRAQALLGTAPNPCHRYRWSQPCTAYSGAHTCGQVRRVPMSFVRGPMRPHLTDRQREIERVAEGGAFVWPRGGDRADAYRGMLRELLDDLDAANAEIARLRAPRKDEP